MIDTARRRFVDDDLWLATIWRHHLSHCFFSAASSPSTDPTDNDNDDDDDDDDDNNDNDDDNNDNDDDDDDDDDDAIESMNQSIDVRMID